MAKMKQELAASIKAGAIGFSTSRTRNHQTSDGYPVASRIATWDEVKELVGVMGELGAGIFEIASEEVGRDPFTKGRMDTEWPWTEVDEGSKTWTR